MPFFVYRVSSRTKEKLWRDENLNLASTYSTKRKTTTNENTRLFSMRKDVSISRMLPQTLRTRVQVLEVRKQGCHRFVGERHYRAIRNDPLRADTVDSVLRRELSRIRRFQNDAVEAEIFRAVVQNFLHLLIFMIYESEFREFCSCPKYHEIELRNTAVSLNPKRPLSNFRHF